MLAYMGLMNKIKKMVQLDYEPERISEALFTECDTSDDLDIVEVYDVAIVAEENPEQLLAQLGAFGISSPQEIELLTKALVQFRKDYEAEADDDDETATE
jgi:hypothetical protein